MNRTAAADMIADEVRVYARRYGVIINKDLAEARVSELRGGDDSLIVTRAALLANPKTVLRIALGRGEL